MHISVTLLIKTFIWFTYQPLFPLSFPPFLDLCLYSNLFPSSLPTSPFRNGQNSFNI